MTESTIRKAIAKDNLDTENEIRRIDAEIALINSQKAAFIKLEEGKIEEIEDSEDEVRD